MKSNNKLDWVKNYGGHPSTAQNSIAHCLALLSDFEAVQVSIDAFDAPSVIDGQSDFYAFMKTLYQDMYKAPGTYAVPTAAYDEYMASIDIDIAFADEHKSDAKEAGLRQAFQQAIQFYPDYFYQLGLAADGICAKSRALVVSKAKYSQVLKGLDSPRIRKENAQRLNALADRGISVEEDGERCYITCKQFPNMFLGLWVLCTAPESKYKYMNYLRLDYKGYHRAIPEIQDIKKTMDQGHRETITQLLSLMDNPKIKAKVHPLASITSNHKWKVEYTLNSKRIFEFYAGPAYLVVHIFFKDTQTLGKIIAILENKDAALFAWLRDKLIEKLCNCPRNTKVLFGKEEKRICGSSNKVEILNPNQKDVEKSIALMNALREL